MSKIFILFISFGISLYAKNIVIEHNATKSYGQNKIIFTSMNNCKEYILRHKMYKTNCATYKEGDKIDPKNVIPIGFDFFLKTK